MSRPKSAVVVGQRNRHTTSKKQFKRLKFEGDVESMVSQKTGASSQMFSKVSGKSYISQLETNLNKEKRARKQLEREI